MVVTLEFRRKTADGYIHEVGLDENERVQVLGATLIGPDVQFDYVIISGEARS